MNHTLVVHPETPCAVVKSLQAEVLPAAGVYWQFRYVLRGDLGQLLIPLREPPALTGTDGLWQHTCFEAFIGEPGKNTYREFNFSPSGQWAAYAFSDYRQRITWDIGEPPLINVSQNSGELIMVVSILAMDLISHPYKGELSLGLTAVIEECHGDKSYWALNHPKPNPDFHHRAGFSARIFIK